VLKPIERQRVAEEVAEQLRSLILKGQYRPGDKLPPERQLAKDLGVNRGSLREALKKLEHQGLILIRQGDGTRVQNFMETGGIDLMSHLVMAQQGHVDLLRDILEFRRIYGREVARLAAERAGADDRARLAEIAARAEAPGLSPAELLAIDFDFYVALTQATKNRAFTLLINTTRQAVMAFAPFFAGAGVSTATMRGHHRALLDALGAKDSAAAARVADDYMALGAQALVALAGPPKP
jgi:GntR family transcriptional repressor for pyruvate dehydrogenase complex